VPQALDDLHSLADACGELPDVRIRVNFESVALGDVDDLVPGSGRIEASALPESDVLPHGEGVDEAVMLMDHADAVPGGIDRVIDDAVLSIEGHRTVVRQRQTDDHLHEGRLAGPVLSEDAVDLAGVEIEIDRVAGDHLPIPLGHPPQLEDGRWPILSLRGHVHGSPMSSVCVVVGTGWCPPQAHSSVVSLGDC